MFHERYWKPYTASIYNCEEKQKPNTKIKNVDIIILKKKKKNSLKTKRYPKYRKGGTQGMI
jgi:hypothetical protein